MSHHSRIHPLTSARSLTRAGVRSTIITLSTAACAVSIAVCGIAVSSASATTTDTNARDSFGGSVSSGFGTADTGGTWAGAPARDFSVANGYGKIGPVAAGTSATTMLSDVVAGDETVTAQFTLPKLPALSTGNFVGLELRRQSNGTAYRVKLRVQPDGGMTLGFSRVIAGSETTIGTRQVLASKATAGQPIFVQAQVSGTSSVVVSASVYASGNSSASTTNSFTDTSASAITAAGSIGVWAYDPSGAAPLNAQVDNITGTTPLSSTPPTSTPPSSTPPSSTPPSSTPPSSTPPTSTPPSSTPPSTTPPSSTPPTTTPPSTPPSSSEPVGSADPGDATYSIPDNAIYVSAADGSDTNPGTITAPLQSVTHAVAIAPTGSTIVLRGGTYHEDVTVPAKKSLTIEGYPGEAAWFDGSIPVSTWTSTSNSNGAVWAHSGWTAQFDHTAGYSTSSAAGGAWLQKAYPMAAHPDQTYLDGTALTQVGSLDQVSTGTFYVDYNSDTLYLGSDPTGHQILASTLTQALLINSPNTTIRGLGIHRYATPVPLLGTVALDAANDTITDTTINDNASQGLHLGGPNDTVDHVTTTNNGLLGIQTNHADNMTISNSLVTNNNSQHFNFAPVAGGIKLTRSRNLTVTNNTVTGNDGNGLWFDESCYNMTATGNTLSNNTRTGLSVEISATGIYANNTLTGNTFDGIRITDTSNIQVWNNTFSANNSRNLELVQDLRTNTPNAPGHDPRQPNPDPTISWITANIQVSNNIFIGGGQFHIYANDQTGNRTANQMQLTIDGNLLSAPTTQGYAPFGWNTAPNTITRYYTPTQYTNATGDGTHNTMADGATPNAMAPAAASDSSSALALPAAVATAVGEPTGTQHLGTF